MAYLSKEQYAYRRESAAKRNAENEAIAICNGMSQEEASLVSELCSFRHELHVSVSSLTRSGEGSAELRRRADDLDYRIEASTLPRICFASMLDDIDDLDGLIYNYGDDVPADHSSEDFSEWYDENYRRIYAEYEGVNVMIERYLRALDDEFGTHWCPCGALRMYL